METDSKVDRRSFIRSTALLTSAAFVGISPFLSYAAEKKDENKMGVEETSPVEDLMREHGGLNRILLIYEESLRRIHAKLDMDPALLNKSAKLIHDFVEGYHEKLEEEHIFPRLEKSGKLLDLIKVLRAQHKAGRDVTTTILGLSKTPAMKNATDREALSDALRKFIRMYRPHEAREDTIVFPEFKTVITPKEYDVLGDKFEDREHELFGKEGFEGIVVQIAAIEKALGIYDLAQFTPR